jgi:hypothetical protein
VNEQGQALQRAIAQARAQGRLTRGLWVLLKCGQERCGTWEANVWVEEKPGCLPWQAPAYCVRCRQPLVFDGSTSVEVAYRLEG